MNRIRYTRPGLGRLPVVLMGIALLSAAALFNRALAQQSQQQTGDQAQATAAEVVKPTRRTMVRELRMPATLMADEQVDLYAKTSGYVARIDLDIGDRVAKGDVLLEIDVPEMADEAAQAEAVLAANRAKVQAAEAKAVQAGQMVETARAQVQRYTAQYELDQINLKRKEELRQGNAIPQQALDEARSAHAIAEAQLQIAHAQVAGAEAQKLAAVADVEVANAQVLVSKANVTRLRTLMDYASIKAPFDGRITVRYVDHGTFVRSAAEGTSEPLLRVAKTDTIRVVLEIPEVDALYVRVGTEVEIDVRALGGHPFPGTVSRIAGALSPSTRSMRAEIDVHNADGRLAPGMYARVLIKLETKAQAMMVPSKALRVLGGETVVFVAADGVAGGVPSPVGTGRE